MPPPSTIYPLRTHMTAASSKPASTRPLNVLFFLGLCVAAVGIISFIIYLCFKIYALFRKDPNTHTRTRGSSRWGACLTRRKAKVPQIKLVRLSASIVACGAYRSLQFSPDIPEWAVTYNNYLQSPTDSDGPITPTQQFPRGLGIDFHDVDIDTKHRVDNDQLPVPYLEGSAELTRQQCRNPEAIADTVTCTTSSN